MRLFLGAATAGAVATIITIMSIAAYTSAGAAETTVTVDDFYFCEAAFEGAVCNTEVAAGDTVIWSVAGGFHTVTRCDEEYTTCPDAGGFDSGQLTQGDLFQQTFNDPGTFYYICTFHPNLMRGTVTVTGVQETPSPTPAGDTPSPSPQQTSAPASVTATPAGVPSTGGGDSSSAATSSLVLMVVGGIVALGAAGLVIRSMVSARRP